MIISQSNKLIWTLQILSLELTPPAYVFSLDFLSRMQSIPWNNQNSLFIIYLYVYFFSFRWALFTLVHVSQLMFPNHIFHFIWRRHFAFRRWDEQNISALSSLNLGPVNMNQPEGSSLQFESERPHTPPDVWDDPAFDKNSYVIIVNDRRKIR